MDWPNDMYQWMGLHRSQSILFAMSPRHFVNDEDNNNNNNSKGHDNNDHQYHDDHDDFGNFDFHNLHSGWDVSKQLPRSGSTALAMVTG